MKRRALWGILSLVLIVVAYLSGLYYFKDKFGPYSKIGDIDVSYMTYNNAVNAIENKLSEHKLTVKEVDRVIAEVKLKDMGEFNHVEVLDKAWSNRNNYLFFNYSIDNVNYDFKPNNKLTKDEFLKLINIDNGKRNKSEDAYINNKFEVIKEVFGNQIDANKTYSLFSKNNDEIDVSEAYILPSVYQDSDIIKAAQKAIKSILEQDLVLNVKGKSVKIPNSLIEEGLSYNWNGNIISYDKDLLIEWLISINDKYMTYTKPFQFNSTLQGPVEVPGGTLGWSIDRKLTAVELKNAILNTSGKVDAIIVGDDYDLSQDSGSYVEVDIANQTMFIYVNGKLALETAIVSGMAGGTPPTPTVPGAYQVWNKESPSVLVGTNMQTGVNYSQPVDYWLPFDEIGQGIHDANWQPVFGGDSYIYSGSQGCINTPPYLMPEVFDLVEVGFPVMVF